MPSATDPAGPNQPACHECGARVDSDANFCPACGADLHEGSHPQFCGSCGSRFTPGDAFCADCGAERGGTESERSDAYATDTGATPTPTGADGAASVGDDDADSRTRDGSARPGDAAFRRRIQQHLDAGWEIKRDDGDAVVLVDRDIGSMPIHVLLLLTTGGAGNLLYGYYHYAMLAETRRLSVDDEYYPMPKRTPDEETAVTTASAYALSAVVLVVGLFVAGVAAGGGSFAMTAVGLLLAAAGLSVAPPVEERLDRRHGVTTFGRHKTVDHRVLEPVDPVDEPCVVCDQKFDGGVVRRRRDETTVAGVPVRTHEYELNHYCAVCAREELFGMSRAAASSPDSQPATSVETLRADPVDGEESTDDVDRPTDADLSETTEPADE
ncbi:MAG: zinc ribbon domain-containing protein [Halorubrum sp.]